MTYRYPVFELITTFKQHFDNADIRPSLALYWVQITVMNLAKQHIEKRGGGRFIKLFTANVLTDLTTSTHEKHVVIPEDVFDLDHEGGVSVSYNFDSGKCGEAPYYTQPFGHTTYDELPRLNGDECIKPCPERPYLYRVDNSLYFPGLECINVPSVKLALKTSIGPLDVCDFDDTIPLPEHLLEVLTYRVRKLGQMALMMPKERVSDGDDAVAEGQQIPQAGNIPAQVNQQ